MTTRRLTTLLALGAASALTLTACAGTGGTSETSGSDAATLSVVASTDVYGQIAEEIGGDAVTVTSIIASAAQDPHEFEPTAQDQLTVSEADLIIENGGGYDGFMDAMIEASGTTAPVITAATFNADYPGDDGAAETEDAHSDEDGHDHAHIEGFNEHVWYDPHTMEHLAEAIAEELSTLDPDNADLFETNAAAFVDQIAGLEASLDEISAAHAGEGVFVTEPVPVYLIVAAGLENLTPEAFSEAVEEGQDVPPATLLEALGIVEDGSVKVVIANAQTGGAETTKIIDTATAQSIPVLEFTETLPEGQTYISWMQQNITELADALGA
ncbi:MAG TPA: metal ABC transporter substrate-binding protein [Microbacterium sp.]|nr:metal ABC transporter substrate-binding protein [Microbacterium sp.]